MSYLSMFSFEKISTPADQCERHCSSMDKTRAHAPKASKASKGSKASKQTQSESVNKTCFPPPPASQEPKAHMVHEFCADTLNSKRVAVLYVDNLLL